MDKMFAESETQLKEIIFISHYAAAQKLFIENSIFFCYQSLIIL